MSLDPWIQPKLLVVFSLASQYDLKRDKVSKWKTRYKIGTEWFCLLTLNPGKSFCQMSIKKFPDKPWTWRNCVEIIVQDNCPWLCFWSVYYRLGMKTRRPCPWFQIKSNVMLSCGATSTLAALWAAGIIIRQDRIDHVQFSILSKLFMEFNLLWKGDFLWRSTH